MINSESKNCSTDNPTNQAQNNIKNKFKNWIKKKGNRSIVLMFINIIMLIAFVYFSNQQGSQTRKALKIADTVSKMELRAYIDVSFNGFAMPPSKDNMFYMNFNIFNYGKTPAKVIDIGGQIEILPFPLEDGFIPTYTPHYRYKQITISQPGDTSFNGKVRALEYFSDSDIIKTKQRFFNQAVYIFMKITYIDCFNIVHSTTKCLFADPNNMIIDGDIISRFMWVGYEKYNDFD